MENFITKISKVVKHWYLFLLIGVVFLITGIWTLFRPVSAYAALSMLFSITFFISGMSRVIFSIANRKVAANWGWGLVFGIIVLILGLYLMLSPALSMSTLAIFVGFLTLMYSFNTIMYSFELKSYDTSGWGFPLVFGILGLIFSFMMISNPLFAVDFVVIYTAVSFISLAIGYMIYAFRLRKLKKWTKKVPRELKNRLDEVIAEIKQHMD